jgi:hypothetical protein
MDKMCCGHGLVAAVSPNRGTLQVCFPRLYYDDGIIGVNFLGLRIMVGTA